jgi:fructose-1-phosphate kinase PfkB-like protein
VTVRPSAAELLKTPGALLTRTHLAELGLGRAAIDAVFQKLDVVVFPGSTRPHIHAEAYVALVAQSTYGEKRVR